MCAYHPIYTARNERQQALVKFALVKRVLETHVSTQMSTMNFVLMIKRRSTKFIDRKVEG